MIQKVSQSSSNSNSRSSRGSCEEKQGGEPKPIRHEFFDNTTMRKKKRRTIRRSWGCMLDALHDRRQSLQTNY
ncbi:unnamed protein product [Musa hybrid cultivar]